MKSSYFWIALIFVMIGTIGNWMMIDEGRQGSRNPSGTHSGYVGTGAWHK